MEKEPLKKVDRFVISKKVLGQGAFGIVHQGWVEADPTIQVAVKITPMKNLKDKKILDLMNKEISVMKAVHHPNLVNLYEAVTTPNNLYLFMEFCNQGDLKYYWEKKNKKLEENEIISILTDICKGFQCLYAKEIIHRDIKPENILMHDNHAKIADFGFARFIIDSGMEKLQDISKKGTPVYCPVQILEMKAFSSKCEIWSLGIMIYELIFGTTPWKGFSIFNIAENIKNQPLFIPSFPPISPWLKDLLCKMMVIEDTGRIAWPDVFKQLKLI